jgi:biotin transporter BioY
MSWIARKLHSQASESQLSLVLTVCVIAMSIMSIGILWQAQIIASQREDLRYLMGLKFHG